LLSEKLVPRYYFDVHDDSMVCDESGTECSDLGEVKRRTGDLIANLVVGCIQSRRDQLACRIFVRDQSGQIIYMGAFSYNGAWVNFGARVA
jgi:hypothetical protein